MSIKCNLNLHKEYIIVLTLYGPGGSYDPDTGKIIRLVNNQINTFDFLKTIIHEISHLTLQHLVKKFNLSHAQKETLVDYFCKERLKFPEYQMQNLIDKDFYEYLKNSKEESIEIILKEYF